MSITLSYRCSCGLSTSILDDAQKHADEFRAGHVSSKHVVQVQGYITFRDTSSPADEVAIAAAARAKAVELEVMRQAKHRGLVGKK